MVPTELFVVSVLRALVEVAGLFSGDATLSLHAPELRALGPVRVLGGKVNAVAWVKDASTLVRRSEEEFRDTTGPG